MFDALGCAPAWALLRPRIGVRCSRHQTLAIPSRWPLFGRRLCDASRHGYSPHQQHPPAAMTRRRLNLPPAALWAALLVGLMLSATDVAAAEVTAADAALPDNIVSVVIDPPQVVLDRPGARWSLLVEGRLADQPAAGAQPGAAVTVIDLTSRAEFRSLTPDVVAVSPRGVLSSVGNGQGMVEVVAAGRTLQVPVSVSAADEPRPLHFTNDILPLLTRYACNSSGCHGKAEGQNGFKLSVFGFDPQADYDALTKEARGRRVFPAAADRSLLLQKAAGLAPHGGGTRIAADSLAYRTLHEWIAAGCPRGAADAPSVSSIEIAPSQRVLAMGGRQQLRVVATYTDGHRADVTELAQFQSNHEGLASVDEAGLVSAGDTPGTVAIMASYMGAVATFQALIPRDQALASWPDVPEYNFIDTLVHRRLRQLQIVPSEEADDATYLRRVYLDLTGTLPTADQARQFLLDRSPDKRARLVDDLMRRPEFADVWALLWADLLRVDTQTLGHKNAYAYYRWIRDSFAQNKPLDQFARELITAEGPLDEAPAGHFYSVVKRPGDVSSTLAQVLLGVRIACAECHHHPFDRWSQTDYYGMQAYFQQLRTKDLGGRKALFSQGLPKVLHPRTGEVVPPHPLGESPAAEETAQPSNALPQVDIRRELADWLVAPQNPWFARSMANRVWARMMGRGLVEPVDDFRLTNPPSNPELLDALAAHLVESGYDLRALIRTIAASRTYQLSSRPNETNAADQQNYSRALFKRLNAEVLLDAVCQVTGVPEKFSGVPAGSRAVQLWDNRVSHYFLKVFGRPIRETACECERNVEPSIAQVLHLMNGPEIQAKIGHAGGRVAQLCRTIADDGQLAEEIYLTVFARQPTAEELAVAVEHLRTATENGTTGSAAARTSARQKAAEDLTWSLMNSLEFVFNH